jgi:SAM-dependent methyltransferase
VTEPAADATRRSYDGVARCYAARFKHELDDKPFDREFLDAVADAIPRRGWCVDLGCGPSQIGAYLARRGLAILSVDVSREMLQHAFVLLPEGGRVQADMRVLPFADGSIAGIVAFYSLIHIPRTELMTTLVELHRVLARRGVMAVAVHAALPGNRADQPMPTTGVLHVEEMLSESVDLDFHFHPAESLGAALRSVGFNLVRATERDPYDAPVEAQTRRAYVLARKGP